MLPTVPRPTSAPDASAWSPKAPQGMRTLWLVPLLVAGCGGDNGSTGPGNESAVVAHTASSQVGTVGQPVGIRPAVRVTRGSSPLAGAAVTFAVVTGGGTIEGGSQTTDANGVATVGAWTLGTGSGDQTLRATLDGAAGSALTFTATAQPGPPAGATAHAGAAQNGHAHRNVPVRPAVLVSDQFGNPVPGVSVSFAVTTGEGTITGATPVTAASGIAEIGAWTLGGVIGPQQLTATVQAGGAALPPLNFTANASELLLQPAADTVLTGGVLRVSRLIIPAGRTITTTSALTLEADLELRIDGTLRGACVAINLKTTAAATITGLVDNGCTPAGVPAALQITAEGGYSLAGATIEASGNAVITTQAAPALRYLVPFGSVLASVPQGSTGPVPCDLSDTDLRPSVERAPDGAPGVPRGADGARGFEWIVECSGDLRIHGNVLIKGQSGGNGGASTHSDAILASATGGNGGQGGITRLVSHTGVIQFNGTGNRIESGFGGDGGAAHATALPSALGPKAPSARATGGAGANPGAVELQAAGGTVVLAPFEIAIGPAGRGGDAVARGADGQPASATQAAQAGGDANATGGVGGDSPEQVFTSSPAGAGARGGAQRAQAAGSGGSFSVVGGELVTFIAAEAGNGGNAEVRGGNGGAGNATFPDGGAGGDMLVQGGHGGSAAVKDLQNVGFGRSGDGGNALVENGNGGLGASRCVPPLPGGKGGRGGNAGGAAGMTGMIAPSLPGTDGLMTVIGAANGGAGGNGQAPGTGGAAGQPPLVVNVANASFVPGADGGPCPAGPPSISVIPGFFVGSGSAVVNGCSMSPGGTFGPTLVLGTAPGTLNWVSTFTLVGQYNTTTGQFMASTTMISGNFELTERVTGVFEFVNPPTDNRVRFRGQLSFDQKNLTTMAMCTTTYQLTVIRQP